MKVARTIGNIKLLGREKTLFLTSRMAPLWCYEKVFRWVEEFDRWQCAVCFNTSELEEEVLKALLVCHVPTVLVVTGKFHNTYNVQIEQALKEDRLLVLVLQREESDGKGYIARLRNQWVIGHVQHIVCGYINPNGSIFGLLAGHSNVTHLLDKADMKAAEAVEKPYRWTVAEDKQLLRMYYEDMGIHAIHKAIGRQYSTVYRRVKSLTMNDELLKGREFEDYVLEQLGIANNDRLTLKEWRGDKSLPGIYPEGNSNPDLVLEYDGRPFAIECKWRSHLPKDIDKELLPPARAALFEKYAKERRMPIFLLLGIGGLPSDPDVLYIMSDFKAPMPTIIQAEQLLETITKLIPTPVKKERVIRPLIKPYPNAYAPWSTEDDKLLGELYESGKTIDELTKLFGRNSGGIKSRLRKLNLI
ncbi:MAG: hypothetical protein J6I41_07295 [Bacteroidales bacterium]|nr:hypothetical protein [Bacteroidales bacterium]